MPRYRELQPEVAIDVGARSQSSGAEQAARELSASLNSFSRNALEFSSTRINQNLAKAGQQAGAATEGTPELKKGIAGATAWGRAYNDAALRSYAIRQEADLEEQAARLQVEAGTDPDTFSRSMEAMRDGVLEEAPAEARGILSEMYLRRTAAGLAQINQQLAQEIRNEDAVLVEQQVERLSDRISRLRSQDTFEAHAAADEEEERLFALLEGARNDNTLTEGEYLASVRLTEQKIIFDTVKQRFTDELESPYGDPIGFIEDLKEINRTSEQLTPDEEQKLENTLIAELRERAALRSMRESQADNEAKAIQERTDTQLTAELLGGTLSTQDLFEATSNGILDPARALTLSNALNSRNESPPASDPETRATYERFLIRADEDQIWNDPDLNWNDKSDLVQRLQGLTAEWQGQPRAKEGYDRLERALGIQRGTPMRALSEEEIEALDNAQTEYFNTMEALPPDQREAQALIVAEDITKNVIRRQESSELQSFRRRLQVVNDKLADDSIRGHERKVYEDDKIRFQNKIAELEARLKAGGE